MKLVIVEYENVKKSNYYELCYDSGDSGSQRVYLMKEKEGDREDYSPLVKASPLQVLDINGDDNFHDGRWEGFLTDDYYNKIVQLKIEDIYSLVGKYSTL